MFRLLAILIVLIVYGSFYPWRFNGSHGDIGSAVYFLLAGGGRGYFADALVNVVFYMPVGACAYLTFRRRLPVLAASLAAVALGTTLSFSVEVAQAYAARRLSSIFDVYANAAGSIAGVIVAIIFSKLSLLLHRRAGWRRSDSGAVAVILCWLAYLLFPFLPVLAMNAIRAKLAHARVFALLPFASTAVAWFTIGNALKETGVRNPRLLCLTSVLLIPGQLLIFNRQPTIADFAGAVVGAALFACTYTYKRGTAPRAAAVAMMCSLIVRGLMPFEVAAHPREFTWIPFAALIEGAWYQTSQILSEKLFFYGAAIWSLQNAGAKLSTATFAVAAVLLSIEGAQLWLQRTPEITDPLLALIIGVGLDAFRSQAKRTSSPFGTSA